MSDLELSILASLDGNDLRLLPYLPELLQDLDDLGASPAQIESLLSAQTGLPAAARVLDLGCGKGSVALHLLERHPWVALGVDGMSAFVERARQRAEALGLAERCRFEVADIRDWPGAGHFDVIVLGAVGPVLGDEVTTLRRLDAWLAPRGRVVMDAVYVPDGTASRNTSYNQTRGELLDAIARAGFGVLGEAQQAGADRAEEHSAMFEAIRARAAALAGRHPEDRALFEAYVADQAREFEILGQEIVDVLLLLGRTTPGG
ncbi:MAG: class I SAM-dependent methyltransferase [Vicinamibacteria bacterium]|nr:class I SAM-dependent methyltransferase [Vicinamibacteria bacterium]